MNTIWIKKTSLCYLGLVMILVSLSSCSRSRTPQFYLLTTPETSKIKSAGAMTENSRIILIEKVEIAEYLKRPQIVKRLSGNEIKYLEFHRWAEPLGSNIASVVHVNLESILTKDMILLDQLSSLDSINYSVAIKVHQLDISEDNHVNLRLETSICEDKNPIPLKILNNEYESDQTQKDFNDIIGEMSSYLNEYCKNLAAVLNAM